MAYIDDVFNTSGKIPTDSDFWDGAVDEFVTSDGITAGFGKVLGEQVFKPINSPTTPFYSRFVGSPLSLGSAWTERAVNKKNLKHFNPKATAQDTLGFYDSTGIEKTYNLNVAGWIPNSIPSDLETAEMMIENYSIGSLNSRLVDIVLDAYQQGMESALEKYAVSMTKSKDNIDFDSDIVAGFGKLMDIAVDMMGDDVHYNELTADENAGIYTHSTRILCFLPAKLYNAYRNAKAVLPSPGELVSNVEFIPMYNDIATPITTAEWNDGRGAIAEALTWDSKPVAIDEDKPDVFMCSAEKFVYRPYRGTYRMGTHRNVAGDFDNVHLVWKGAIANHPWDNGIRIYNASD
jgi:hypothetical protein